MQRFKSPGSGQKFLSTHAAVYNTFNAQRHLVHAPTYRVLRADALATWRTAVAAARQLLRSTTAHVGHGNVTTPLNWLIHKRGEGASP